MKKTILITLVVLFGLSMQAHEPDYRYTKPKPIDGFGQKYRLGSYKFKRVRNAGIILVATGSSVILGGLIYSAPKIKDFKWDGEYDMKAVQQSTWVTTAVVVTSVAIIAIGASLWVTGAIKMKNGRFAKYRVGINQGQPCLALNI